jgi:hypothetical protein
LVAPVASAEREFHSDVLVFWVQAPERLTTQRRRDLRQVPRDRRRRTVHP